MKKGFTLIELLAVIVVLAIIAIIATPIITDVIEESKESANLRSIEGYAKAVKQKYYNDSLDGSKPVIDSTFLSNVDTSGGEVKCDSVLYNNGPILYKCTVQNSEKKYCYANEQHYACDDEDYLAIFTGSGGVETGNLISTLLEQYQEGNTTGLVKDKTNPNLYYYKGTNEQVSNNFLWYGGHQWRVLEFDTSAKTLTLITQQPLTAIQPASAVWESQEAYESSYINTWLNDYLWNSLDSSIQNNILDSTFNIGIYTDVDEITTTQRVGLLDEEQYKRAGEADSFLDIKNWWWLGNRYSSSYVRSVDSSGILNYSSPSSSYGVRAVIKISDITIIGGDGTLASNYQVGNKATNTDNVQVGEYINVPYSGSDSACGSDNMCTFRVVSKDSNSIKVVLNGLLPTTSKYGSSTTISTSHTIYTPLNTFAEGISDIYRYTGKKTFYIGDYPSTATNYKDVQDETLEASVGLPIVGEMFSGNDIDLSTSSIKTFVDVNTIENPTTSDYYWTMNRYSSSFVRLVINNGNLSNTSPSGSGGVRAVIYLKSGTSAITFTGGEGTPNSPYVLQ